jgi:hypothetical protein
MAPVQVSHPAIMSRLGRRAPQRRSPREALAGFAACCPRHEPVPWIVPERATCPFDPPAHARLRADFPGRPARRVTAVARRRRRSPAAARAAGTDPRLLSNEPDRVKSLLAKPSEITTLLT